MVYKFFVSNSQRNTFITFSIAIVVVSAFFTTLLPLRGEEAFFMLPAAMIAFPWSVIFPHLTDTDVTVFGVILLTVCMIGNVYFVTRFIIKWDNSSNGKAG